MNYYPDRDGHIFELDSGGATSSELLAHHLPRSRVAGDDAAAKSAVARLIDDLRFGAADTGSLRDGGAGNNPAPLSTIGT